MMKNIGVLDSSLIKSQVNKLRRVINNAQSKLTRDYDLVTRSRAQLIISAWFILIVISLFTIFGASSIKGLNQFNDGYFFVRKQFLVSCFCGVFLLYSYLIPKKLFGHFSLPVYLIVVLILSLIFIPGFYVEIGGASRWINIFSFRFQPGELAKLALIMLVAKNISRTSFNSQCFFTGVLPNICFFGILGGLLMLQPDFGTSVLLAGVCFFMLVVAGIKKSVMAGFLLSGVFLVVVMIAVAPYRVNRIIAFLDPWKQADKGGFQIIQSYLGFQNGQIWGSGFGESKQKLFFLPEAHTDFILSVIAEELGFVGVLFVLGCFFTLIYCGFRITHSQKDLFWRFICLGITLMISFQVIFNTSVVMGMLPTKGIALPFVSNGASSLLIFSIMLGVLLRANFNNPLKKIK